jgi:hypothetical protein
MGRSELSLKIKNTFVAAQKSADSIIAVSQISEPLHLQLFLFVFLKRRYQTYLLLLLVLLVAVYRYRHDGEG